MPLPTDPHPGSETSPATELAELEARLSAATETGRYRVISRVGAGGMGVVYKAIDTRLNRAVAIKAILGAGRLEGATARLRKEARTAASLDHPYICRVYELVQTPDEQLIVMEFVEGETLSAILSRGVLPLATTLQLGIEIAEGLANAHAHGLVHRDLKPANIMVTPHGHIKLLDFGLARLDPTSTPTGEAQTSVQSHDAFAGTPYYMAPEQADGRAVTMHADIFSLGVVLFECVTGRLPFDAPNRFEYVAHLRLAPPFSVQQLAPGTPVDLGRLIDSCLKKAPANRPESASAIVDELKRIAGSTSATDQTTGRRGRRSPVVVGSVVVALAFIAALAAWRWMGPRGAPDIEWRLRPFVTPSRENSHSRISPDKQWISFVSRSGGDTQLLVQHINGREARRVNLPSGTIVDELWATDAQQLIVALRQDNNLVLQIVPAIYDGQATQTVSLPWVRINDLRLLRIIGRTLYAQVKEGDSTFLQRIDLERGSVSNLSAGWNVPGKLLAFDISPDGTRVAYTTFADGHEVLWVARVDGSSARQLTDATSFARLPLWLGDGSTVVYQSNRGGQIDLWQISTDSGLARPLTSGRDAEIPESVSDDGSLITYSQESEEAHLWTWDPVSHKGVQLTHDALNDYSPAASRMSSLIAFQRSRPNASTLSTIDSSVFVATLEPSGGLEIGPSVAADGFAPNISPDGSAVAYLRRGVNADALYLTRLRTNETLVLSSAAPRPLYSPITDEWAEQTIAWNPSGSELYFVDGLNRRTLRRYQHGVTLQAPALVTIAKGAIHDVRPSLDGRTVAYVGWTTNRGPSTVSLVDPTSGTNRQIAQIDGPAYARGWLLNNEGLALVRAATAYDDFTADVEVLTLSSGGVLRHVGQLDRTFVASTRFDPIRALLYATRSDAGVHNVVAFSLVTGKSSQLTDNTLSGIRFSSVHPLPNGSILGVKADRKQDIWLMEADSKPSGGAKTTGR